MCGGLKSPSGLCSSQGVAQRLILLRCNLDLESPTTPNHGRCKKLDPISEVPWSTDSALLQEEQQYGSVDTSAEESVTGLKLVQHDFSPMTVPSVVANHVIRWGLQAALTVFVACYGLFSASDFENPSSK